MNCYYSKKRVDRTKKAEVKDIDASYLGIPNMLEASGGLAYTNISQTAEL
jgi:hypothetical protein